MKIADVVLTSPVLWKSNVLEADPTRRQAVVGAVTTTAPALSPGATALYSAFALGTTVAGTYHGYKRNNSAGWALGWGLFSSVLPIIALPIMLAQGFAQKK